MISILDTEPGGQRVSAKVYPFREIAPAIALAIRLSRVLDRPVTVWVEGAQVGGPVDGRKP